MWLLAGLGALPVLMLILVGVLVWRGEGDIERSSEERLRAAARVVAAEAREMVADTRARLDRYVGSRPEGGVFSGAAPTIADDDAQGLLSLVLVFDAAGRLRAAAGTEAPGITIRDREYFGDLAAGQQWATSALIEQTAFGEPVFAVARRLTVNGQFDGAAVVYLPADGLGRAWSAVELGEDSSIAIYRSDGALVSAFPLPDRDDDRTFDSRTTFAASGNQGIVRTAPRDRDDGERLTAFEAIPDMMLVATASSSLAATAAASQERTAGTLLAVIPVVVVLFIVCGLMALTLIRQERQSAALAVTARQNETLLQEIHHRVKNNLQMVTAMIRLQPGMDAAKEQLAARIQAMTAVHQLMYESNEFSFLDARDYVERLLAGLELGHSSAVLIERRVDALKLSSDQVQPIGLIINEAVTNAFKHAFPDGRPGKILVALTRVDDRHAELVIADDGIGYDVTATTRMGSKLIRNLTSQLQGEIKLGTQGGRGTRMAIRFPLLAASS
jgi:two-component sensor histidine kinase